MICNEGKAESFKCSPASQRIHEKAGFVTSEDRSCEIRVQLEIKRVEGRDFNEEEIVSI